MTRAITRAATAAGLPLILLATWWFASAGSTDFYKPPLETIICVFPGTWTWDRIQGDVLPSIVRLLIGYALALAVGITGGILVGLNRALRALLEPVLEFLRAVPPPILVPILILIAGFGNLTKVLVIVIGGLWPVLLNTVEGVRGTDEVLADTCRSYRIGGWLRLRTFVLRAAGPQIMVGARQALSISIIMMVIGEILGTTDGVGYSIIEFQRGFQIPEMWSGVFVLGALGVLLALLFRIIERRILTWYHGVRAATRGGIH